MKAFWDAAGDEGVGRPTSRDLPRRWDHSGQGSKVFLEMIFIAIEGVGSTYEPRGVVAEEAISFAEFR